MNYTLDIISKLPEFSNKLFKKHNVEGIETIGVWGNEPFEIKFRNNTAEKVQIKVSIDGTDVLTGDIADTTITKDMWVVQAYSDINLKAWPETHKGGAQFVFTHAGDSVANHTHGDVSSRGVIAVAVFREGHKDPARFVEHHYHHDYWWNKYYTYPYYDNIWLGGFINNTTLGGGGTYGAATYSSGNLTCSTNNSSFNAADTSFAETEEAALPGVGAGDHVVQNISYVQGLTKPYFTETVRVRYLWWDDLVEKLKNATKSAAHASGFPGDSPKLMSLGSTPRISTQKQTARQEQSFARF